MVRTIFDLGFVLKACFISSESFVLTSPTYAKGFLLGSGYYAVFGCFLFLLFSSSAFSAFEWKGPFTVQDTSLRWDNGYAVTDVTVKEKELFSTGCIVSDEQGITSYRPTAINSWSNQWLSMLMAAQAQEKKVMLFVDSANCSSWGGVLFNGVRILTD